MAESIQCYQCGTRMTLEDLASNDGDCPECDVEIHLAEYLSKALADIAVLRAQQSSQAGEAVNVAGIRISTDGFGSYIADSTMGIGPAFPGEVREPLMTVAQHNRIMEAAKHDTELVELMREVLGSISYEQHYGLFGRIKAKLAELQK